MKAYALDCLGGGVLTRILLLDFDVTLSWGLLVKLEGIPGVIGVFEEVKGSDSHYTIHLSPRMDSEDIEVARIDIVDICESHIELKNRL